MFVHFAISHALVAASSSGTLVAGMAKAQASADAAMQLLSLTPFTLAGAEPCAASPVPASYRSRRTTANRLRRQGFPSASNAAWVPRWRTSAPTHVRER